MSKQNSAIKVKLKIEGMHCTACAMNIDFDLEDLDGVVTSKTNYVKQETEVEFDKEKLELSLIIEQIEKTGYQAMPDRLF